MSYYYMSNNSNRMEKGVRAIIVGISYTMFYMQHNVPWLFSWLEIGRHKSNIPNMPTQWQSATEAYDIQMTIGWHHFAGGRMAIEWGNAINEH
jgi:hypothetical protein